jgi:arsenate reductase
MVKKQKVLFVCTGNSCRSQIAEGLLRDMADDRFDVFSCGTHPSRVHPNAIAVMDEWGIDISNHTSDNINDYLDGGINIVISVCDHANKLCPIFPGDVQRIHWSVDDPFRGWNQDESQLDNFRETRQDLKIRIQKLLDDTRSS